MDAMDILLTRRSSKQLQAPAPDAAQLQQMLQAATQVPDHGLLTPYRFVVIQGEAAMARLVASLQEAVVELDLGEEGEKKAARVGTMAPLVIATIASPRADSQPEWEQLLTAGCSVYAMQLAAKVHGFDSVWLSGNWVESDSVRQAFACTAAEKVIALLMVGTGKSAVDGAKNTALEEFVQYW